MRIRTRILLLLVLGTIVPLGISFLFAAGMLEKRFDADVKAGVTRDVQQIAGRVDDRLHWMVESTNMVVDALPFDRISSEDLGRSLVIPYRQLHFASVVALLDSRGQAVVPPYVPTAEQAASENRDVVSREEMERFSESVPLEEALTASVAVGPVYLSDSGSPRVVLATAVAASKDSPTDRWVLAVAVSLRTICEVARMDTGDGRLGILLDSSGRSICGSADSRLERDEHYRIVSELADNEIASYAQAGISYFAMKTDVSLTGWRVFYRVSRASVFSAFRRLRWILAIWILMCCTVTIAGSLILSRGITRPLESLVGASDRIAAGDYSTPITVLSQDEVGRLAESFNRMMTEIRAWHEELNARVDEKTRELAAAQEQIVQTQKFAALGELGAGVAHEINNPLTGIMGNAQLLLTEMEYDADKRELATDIVKNTRRVAEVVDQLLRFSQGQWGETMKPVALEPIVVRSVDMYLERLKEKRVEVYWKHREDVRVRGVDRDLQIVCSSLLDNALRAVDSGGRIGFDVRTVPGGAVMFAVEDNGCGMSEDVRRRALDPFFSKSGSKSGSRGLGLTIVRRIVEEHEGTLTIDSREGEGTCVKVFLSGDVRVSRSES